MYSQEWYTFTLDQAIEVGQRQSPLAISLRKQANSAMWQFKANSASRMPQIGYNSNLPGFTRSINNVVQPDGRTVFVQQRQAYSSGSLNLDQALMPTGGRFSLSSGINRIDLINTDNTINTQWQSTPFLFSYFQPIGKINNLKWNWELQKLRYKQSQKRILEQLEELSIQITQKYFDLLVAEKSLKNSELNLQINDTIFLLAKGRFGLGKIAENDLLQTELGVMNAKNNFDFQALQVSNLMVELANLLGLPSDAIIKLNSPSVAPTFTISPDIALTMAKNNRSDLIRNEIQLKESEMAYRSSKADARPSASMMLSYGLNQTSPDINAVYKSPLDQQRVSLDLNIPIYTFGKNKAQVMASKENFESSQQQVLYSIAQFEQTINYKVKEFEQLKQRLIISAKADTIAQKRYEVAKNRYLIGKIDVTSLTIAQNEKDQALLNYLQTLGNMWTNYYEIRRLTLYDFAIGKEIE